MASLPHEPTLTIGSNQAGASGTSAPRFAVIREVCFACVQQAEETEAAADMPCRRAAGRPIATGTLVQTLPAPDEPRPTRVAVVADARLNLLWFWALGAPVAGENLLSLWPEEFAPMATPLADLPPAQLAALREGLRNADELDARLMAPLAGPLDRATARTAV